MSAEMDRMVAFAALSQEVMTENITSPYKDVLMDLHHKSLNTVVTTKAQFIKKSMLSRELF